MGSDDLQQALDAYCEAYGVDKPKRSMRQYLKEHRELGVSSSGYMVLKGFKLNPDLIASVQLTSWRAE